MANSTSIQVRIDRKTKTQAQHILSDLNMSMSEAIAIYLKQVVYRHGIPFPIRIPNAKTLRAVRQAESGRGLRRAGSVDKAMKELSK